jgi:hypothetical protein
MSNIMKFCHMFKVRGESAMMWARKEKGSHCTKEIRE